MMKRRPITQTVDRNFAQAVLYAEGRLIDGFQCHGWNIEEYVVESKRASK